MQVKLYPVLIIDRIVQVYLCGFFFPKLHLRNSMSWYLADFKKSNCMAVKDVFPLQVHALSRRLREQRAMGGLEK